MEIWNNENNQATIIGKFAENFTYSHEVLGEKFFRTTLKVNRLSAQTDLLPVTISERLLDITEDYIDQTIKIIGQIRSYNDHAVG